jgi:MerR family transcriptional regulator, thiopeptide resistance regulator
MLLKVGELAKRTGLTVRTFHHYDAIGLLTPSVRSNGGHRLYNREDISRLHTIQSLRYLGISLAEIKTILSGDHTTLPFIIEQQLVALDRQIAQANELRTRLRQLQNRIKSGAEPDLAEWLTTLELMTISGKYFTPDEVIKLQENWNKTEAEWPPLVAAVRTAMTRRHLPDDVDVQILARRWMDLMMRWMGDVSMAMKWETLYRQEPAVRGRHGADLEVINFISGAIHLRIGILSKYLEPQEILRLKLGFDDEWIALGAAARPFIEQDAPLQSPQVQALVSRWVGLIHRNADNDVAIRDKLITAIASEPLLQASSVVGPEVQDFIRRARGANHDQQMTSEVLQHHPRKYHGNE